MTVLTLHPDQELLRDAARSFLSEQHCVRTLRRLRDEPNSMGYDPRLWTAMVDMGWSGVLIDEQHGGTNFGFVGAALLCEQSGRALAASPFNSTAVMAAVALKADPQNATCADALSAIVEGRMTVAAAIDAAARHAPRRVSVTAERAGDAFTLRGHAMGVADAAVADLFIVSAVLGGQGMPLLFAVPRSSAGLSVRWSIGIDGRSYGDLRLQDVVVHGSRLLGPTDGASALLDDMLCAGRLGLAAELLGISRECFERTLEYVKQRVQFGRAIGSFQAIQHRLARLYCEIESLQSLVLAAAQAMQSETRDRIRLTSAAKAKADSVAALATCESVQLHGGIGMTDELDLGLFMKRARAAGALYGDFAFHADLFATQSGF